jgi:hypothetical protein
MYWQRMCWQRINGCVGNGSTDVLAADQRMCWQRINGCAGSGSTDEAGV